MNADEKIADLEARILKLEALLAKVIGVAAQSKFGRAYLKKIMED